MLKSLMIKAMLKRRRRKIKMVRKCQNTRTKLNLKK